MSTSEKLETSRKLPTPSFSTRTILIQKTTLPIRYIRNQAVFRKLVQHQRFS